MTRPEASRSSFRGRARSIPACSATWLAGSRGCSNRLRSRTRFASRAKFRSRAGIYPRPAFTDPARREQEQVLRDTRIAQAAIGAVSLGLLEILEDFGIRPELVGGHSFGELVALRAARRLDNASLTLLAARRGELMAGSGGNEEAGHRCWRSSPKLM